jgi:predicted ATP-grasp superfamily ATP-dependent carboligase
MKQDKPVVNDHDSAIIIGQSHTNTLGLVRSLGMYGVCCNVIIITDNIAADFVSKSKYVKQVDFVLNENAAINLLIKKYTSLPLVSAVFAASDSVAKALDEQYDELSKWFILASVNHQQGGIGHFMDKNVQQELAECAGLCYPKSWVVDCSGQIVLPQDITYPCVIKAIESALGRKDYQIYRNEYELLAGLQSLSNESSLIQVQEYLRKDYEILINGYALGGQDVAPSCVLKKIRHYPLPFGGLSYGYCYNDIERFVDYDALTRFFNMLNYDGLFSVEFLVVGEKAYFLEINLRNDGTSYVSTAGGVNLPYNWYMAHTNRRTCLQKARVNGNYAVSMIGHDIWFVLTGKISPLTWFKQMRQVKGDLLVSQSDLKPVFYWCFSRACAVISKTFKRLFRH